MPIIKYNSLDDYLGSLSPSTGPIFFLICGEAFLVREAFNTLSAFLLKEVGREFGLDQLEGNTASMGDIIEQTTTFSFILSRKVIAVKNAPLFSGAGSSSEISYSKTDMDLLSGLIEKGIPEKHTLVMTCSTLDKRKKVFKTIQAHGTIIDCIVSQGVRKADLDEQRIVLREIGQNLLATPKKRMDAAAFNALVDQTGFSPELFARNIEKLVAYVGANPVIKVNDIKAVVIRDKKDPIFSLTNALLEKDAAKALTVLSSLFKDGFHPLQILKSLENQVRKLLMIKSFIMSFSKIKDPHHFKRMNFNGFKQGMMPMILSYDGKIKKAVEERDSFLLIAKSNKTKGKEKKKVIPADLLLAPNPKSPYPVFLIFQKSENFSLEELKDAMIALSDLDYQLKTSPIEANIGIENFIITICRKGVSSHATENKNSRHYL
ncbi:MAG: DNA polymerase III subunit delta [Desulfobacteraceae bacterium]|nr:DNA polymerase III subunit delta [Desulfobacteraceae bacterium]